MKRKGKAKERPALQLDPARWPAVSTEDWPVLDSLEGPNIGPEDWPSLNDEDPAQEDLQPAAAFYYDYHKKR